MIATGIALRPQVLVADEPTTALDVTVQAQIMELLDGLRAKLGMSLVIITHDLGVVARYAEEVAVMYGGRIVERGSVHQVLKSTVHPYTEALLRSSPRPDADVAGARGDPRPAAEHLGRAHRMQFPPTLPPPRRTVTTASKKSRACAR